VTHGDVLYPTSFLRWWLSADKVTNLGFVVHYILAGLFMFLFLRRLRVSWVGQPWEARLPTVGHPDLLRAARSRREAVRLDDAAARMPGSARGTTRSRLWGYPLLAVAVALCLVSPHVQTTYYLLIATGLWALYLTFGEQRASRSAHG